MSDDIAKDHVCPHCGQPLTPWEGPPETGWGIILVCCNNACPYFVGSNAEVTQFNPDTKLGFRYAEDPANGYKPFNLASYCGSTYMELCDTKE